MHANVFWLFSKMFEPALPATHPKRDTVSPHRTCFFPVAHAQPCTTNYDTDPAFGCLLNRHQTRLWHSPCLVCQQHKPNTYLPTLCPSRSLPPISHHQSVSYLCRMAPSSLIPCFFIPSCWFSRQACWQVGVFWAAEFGTWSLMARNQKKRKLAVICSVVVVGRRMAPLGGRGRHRGWSTRLRGGCSIELRWMKM
jgi:hypothetical protein